jgi:hypothetical protein
MNSPTWRFVRHYLEMVAAMVVGMAVLGVPTDVLLALPDRAAVAWSGWRSRRRPRSARG